MLDRSKVAEELCKYNVFRNMKMKDNGDNEKDTRGISTKTPHLKATLSPPETHLEEIRGEI